MIHDQADVPDFIHSAPRHVTVLLRAFGRQMLLRERYPGSFRTRIAVRKMLLIQNNSICVLCFEIRRVAALANGQNPRIFRGVIKRLLGMLGFRVRTSMSFEK